MLTQPWLWMVAGAALAAVAAAGMWWLLSRQPRRVSVERARKLFHLQRERLEHRFFVLAARSGKPRGLEWVDCDFEDEVSFARDRHNGRLRALVGVTIRFRAIDGGGMEDNPNVGNPRAASAVFHLDGDDWGTHGRILFNLNPSQAIQHFRQELEVVE
jgi:hypothetical protein